MTDHSASARDVLADRFIADFLADWQEHGPEAIAAIRQDKPSDYVRIAAAMLPKERNAKPEPIDELSDAELFERIACVAARAGLAVQPARAGDGGGPPRQP